MDPQNLSTIASMCGAELIAGDPSRMVEAVSHDTRQLKAGSLYVALRGEQFDGSDFIGEAAEKGAIAALSDGKIPSNLDSEFGVLKTTNSLQALASLAASWRERLSLRSIMLTGSSGKTTTKDFTACVLRSSLRVTSTQGNYNNNIGFPLTVLAASVLDQVAVWEIGMNHQGEIAPLAALGKPDIAIITNIGTAHIGFLGSREAIAQEKGDLLALLPSSGVAILPAGDHFFDQLAKRTSARIVSVGIGCGDLRAEKIVSSATGSHFEIHYQGKVYAAFLPMVGRHMISNSLLALAAGVESGVSLEKGIVALRTLQAAKSRFMKHDLQGITLLDASYNANVESMEADLAAMKEMVIQGRRVAVLGRMGELGNYELEAYRRVGKAAAAVLDILITVGHETAELARSAHDHGLKMIYEVADNAEAAELLSSVAREGDLVLVKGSLTAKLKEVVNVFCENVEALKG
ncbi:MAG: UDP-N-acetylmuramoyl-tripeptide--D-alanyl-D-alanine ligase [Chthoniobacterales bacterium]